MKELLRILVAVFVAALARPSLAAEVQRPNVVVIFSDNHGAWTLGCYGNKEIKTPHIDRLAREGTRLTRAYCCTPVCSPSRATFLTGLIPSQHGIANFLPTNRGINVGPQASCLINGFGSLPEVLAKAGYRCGMTGKWHLGDSLHPQLGFDYWFAIPEGRTLKNFYDEQVVWQGRLKTQPGYLNDAITEHAVEFIEQSADKPFFLWLAFPPLDFHDCTNRHSDYYNQRTLTSFPEERPNPDANANREKLGNQAAMRTYAAGVSAVDDGVGRVLETLNRLGLDQRTLVVFTADQGMSGGHHGLWGIGNSSRQLNMYDETLQIAMIYRHPEHIAAGRVIGQVTNAYDFLPTILDYLQLKDQMPTAPPRPGASYARALLGQDIAWENTTFHEYLTARAMHSGTWKYVVRQDNPRDELYNLENDPGEQANLAGAAETRTVQNELRRRLDEFFRRFQKPE